MALGLKGGLKGGKARAAKLIPEERRLIAQKGGGGPVGKRALMGSRSC